MPMIRGSSMMSLGTWSRRSTRYQKFLNLCNVFLLITSTILIFSAIVLISFYHLTKLDYWSWYFYATPMVMLGLGLYTFLVCIYGFLISTRESKGLISLIAVFLSIAFLAQIFSVFTAVELRFKIKDAYIPRGETVANMKLYGQDDTVTYNWDWMQRDLRCCGGINYDNGFTDWDSILGGSVPDSCCHQVSDHCGHDIITRSQSNANVFLDLNIWKDGCIEILMVKMRNDVVPMLMVYAGVGVILAIVELITVVLACAYVAQISRRDRKNNHMRDRTGNAGGMYEEEYLQTLNAKETNF